MKARKTNRDTEEWLERLASATHSPQAPFAADRNYERLKERMQPAVPARRRSFSIRQGMLVAAGLALLMVFAWSLSTYLQPDVRTILVATQDETRFLKLPDGSEITLNRYSRLSYPERFGKKRIVQLEGEAYFEVSKNPDKPFQVQAGGITVNVLGTHFNVDAYQTDSLVATTLLEGSVAITNGQKRLLLKPHETAICHRSNGSMNKYTEAQPTNEINWRNGILSFEHTALKEMMRQLSHHFNTVIRIDNKQLADYCLTARFDHNERLEDILNILASIGGFTYRRIQPNMIIINKEN